VKAKVAIITGASGAIGRSLSIELSQKNINIIMIYNKDKKNIHLTLKKMKPGNHSIFQCNFEDPKKIVKLFKNIIKRYKSINILINNAAFTFLIKPQNLINYNNYKKLNKLFNINFLAPVYLTNHFLKYCDKKSENNNVINILSNSIKTLNASNAIYISMKSALKSFTEYCAFHYSKKAKFNTVAPGLILSKNTKKFYHKRIKELKKKNSKTFNLKPSDVSKVIIDKILNKKINGKCIFINNVK
jgi:3-oxoacyl-[acyl-carrier protein] reductase